MHVCKSLRLNFRCISSSKLISTIVEGDQETGVLHSNMIVEGDQETGVLHSNMIVEGDQETGVLHSNMIVEGDQETGVLHSNMGRTYKHYINLSKTQENVI